VELVPILIASQVNKGTGHIRGLRTLKRKTNNLVLRREPTGNPDELDIRR
jgi:hypothetical protein